MVSPSPAAVFTWSGASAGAVGNDNWANIFNWQNNSLPVNNGTADVVIPDTPRDNPVVNLPWSIDTLQFNGGGAYSLSGQPLTIAGNLAHVGSGTATIDNTLVVSSAGMGATWRAANGPLVFNGAITGGMINFFLEAPQPITFDGTALNTFSEEFKVREGTLILSKPATNGAIAGDLAIGNASGSSATVRWDNSEQVSQASGVTVSVRTTGVADLNGKLETLDRMVVEGLVQSASGKLTVVSQLIVGGGEIDMGGGELVVPALVTNSGTNALGTINASLLRLANPKTEFRIGDRNVAVETELNATIADSSSGPSEFRKSFEGVVRLTGASTYTGGTVVEQGTLRVDNAAGSATGTGSVTVLSTGRLDGNGAVSGAVLVASGGVFAPGGSIGSLEVGPLTLAAGSQSQFQINGTVQGTNYDFAVVTGAANLGGSLTVTLQNFNIALGGGQTFTLLSASSIAGSFANVASGSRLTTAEGRGSFLVSYGVGSPFNDNEVVLSSFLLAADFDENGAVNSADLAKWQLGFGTVAAATHMQGDANGDGDVDGADFLIWQRQLGASTSAATTSANVPEPSSMLLLIAAWCAGWTSRKPTAERAERMTAP